MVRISDILKKKMGVNQPAQEAKSEPPKPEPLSAESSMPPQTPPAQFTQAVTQKLPRLEETREQKPPEMQIAKAMKELQPDIERSKKLYAQGIQLITQLLRDAAERKSLELKPIKELVEEVINCFVLGDKTLLVLFHQEESADSYLYNHIVNVMIISVAVGLRLGYNKSGLNELGLVAFLHDIGMIDVIKIAMQPRALSVEEHDRIKEHPNYSVEILSKIKDIPKIVVDAVQQQHERINGEGYPQGLKNGEISEYARIIAAIDVYEALTHNRPYRKKYLPHEAIREMASLNSSFFDPRIFKVLLDIVGIYPIGSYAELNTNEIVKVVTPNDDFPLRPVVNIIFDVQKNRLVEPRLVNLAKQFNLFIKKPLSGDEITRLIKEEKD